MASPGPYLRTRAQWQTDISVPFSLEKTFFRAAYVYVSVLLEPLHL
jgi:hypothetical protein